MHRVVNLESLSQGECQLRNLQRSEVRGHTTRGSEDEQGHGNLVLCWILQHPEDLSISHFLFEVRMKMTKAS